MALSIYKLSDPFEQIESSSTKDKYTIAGKIANNCLNMILTKLVVDASTSDVVKYGTAFITKELTAVKEKYKGIAYPICISVNNIVNNSTQNVILKDGDLVRVELGVHVCGYPAILCYTKYIGTSLAPSAPKARVLKAVINASREIYSNMTSDTKNTDIKKVIEMNAYQNGCNVAYYKQKVQNGVVVPGAISYQVSRYVIDGQNDDGDEYVHRYIANNRVNDVVDMALEDGEVYVIDVLMSSGTGNMSVESNDVYRRDINRYADLKLRSSKDVIGVMNDPFPKVIDKDNVKMRLGLKECVTKSLLVSYPCMSVKENENVARIKFTVIVGETPVLITGKNADDELAKISI